MARGADSKNIVIAKIQEMFPNAFFVDGKELRIPMIEGDEEVQLKVGLTCAKENVPHDGAVNAAAVGVETPAAPVEVSQEEKNRIQSMMAKLNL